MWDKQQSSHIFKQKSSTTKNGISLLLASIYSGYQKYLILACILVASFIGQASNHMENLKLREWSRRGRRRLDKAGRRRRLRVRFLAALAARETSIKTCPLRTALFTGRMMAWRSVVDNLYNLELRIGALCFSAALLRQLASDVVGRDLKIFC